ncbi:hypothetical protein GW932_00755 [archaeon]|nr:hypothetical protein [archaeon]
MIGKAEWFQRRKYGGWGIRPKTWQGWVYIACFLLPIFVFNLFVTSTKSRTIFISVWAFILVVDAIDIMRKLKMDERDRVHEAIAERNALWGILIVLVLGLLYDIITNSIEGRIYVNPFIAGALIVGVVIKAISNIILDRKD